MRAGVAGCAPGLTIHTWPGDASIAFASFPSSPGIIQHSKVNETESGGSIRRIMLVRRQNASLRHSMPRNPCSLLMRCTPVICGKAAGARHFSSVLIMPAAFEHAGVVRMRRSVGALAGRGPRQAHNDPAAGGTRACAHEQTSTQEKVQGAPVRRGQERYEPKHKRMSNVDTSFGSRVLMNWTSNPRAS